MPAEEGLPLDVVERLQPVARRQRHRGRKTQQQPDPEQDIRRCRSMTICRSCATSAEAPAHAYVLGEHGDSEVLAWSAARAGSVPIRSFAAHVGAAITDEVVARIDDGVRRAAYRIIAGKGATWHGIGAGLARIVRAIGGDEGAVLSVSMHTTEVEGVRNVALSIPRVVGRAGVTADLFPDLSADEHEALHRSARLLADTAGSLSL
jgi:L-lactate dehydrogenase